MSDKSLETGEYLRIHQFLAQSRANGPGVRAVVWVQGCTLGCPGCFNAPTHPKQGGEVVSVEELVERILALENTIEGVTISGGEPLQQLAGVANLLHQLKRRSKLSIILFTGFSWVELARMGQKTVSLPHNRYPEQSEGSINSLATPHTPEGRDKNATSFATNLADLPLPLLRDVDVLIAGRYEVAQHLARDLRGSANKQTFFLTSRYSEADMQLIPPAEIVITPEGEVLMSGIDPLKW